ALAEGLEEEDGVEYEREYEREGGEVEAEAGVEYVSDVEESDEEEAGDMEEFDDWLGGQSAEEGSEDGSDDGEEEASDEEAEGADDGTAALKAKLDGLKRKRDAAPAAPKARKKPSRGPKTNIEYEYVPEPAQRAMELAQ
ncbi:Protein MAK16, partial [Friedmanniomyces endolithicus]